ncbi:MAG: hypothetical protein MZV63_12155 [Marinilabiliales bacterium]|nr:hypothetical protein [Marinilabiliales bacterium]
MLYRIPRRERRARSRAGPSTSPSCATDGVEGHRAVRRDEAAAAHRPWARPHPELVLLDEPTVGLDPQVRQELWSLIDALRSGGHDRAHVDALHRGGRAAGRRRGCDGARGRCRARRPTTLRVEHVGERATEYYGPPEKLAAIEEVAQAAGLATRRTGPSIAVLRSETAPDRVLDEPQTLGESVHRTATLEDVFVLLTGEVLE